MKKLFLLSILALSTAASAKIYNWEITRVIDGDTVAVHAPWVPDPIKKEISIRIFGVDTPEKGHRAKCKKENDLAQSATLYTATVIQNAKRTAVEVRSWDKYGGRMLGDIIVDGKSLRVILIANGFAREYYGDAKLSWCN